VVVLPGERHDVVLRLAVSHGTGVAITSAPPGAWIFIDGQQVMAGGAAARTDHTVTGLRPGRHQVELRGPTGATWRQSVMVAPDRITPVRGPLPR
jgi:hypothetical protein